MIMKGILFMDYPEYTTDYENLTKKYNCKLYQFPKDSQNNEDKKNDFLNFVNTHFDYTKGSELVGMYLGYQSFHMLADGLTEEMMETNVNLQHLKMVTLCSRGVNKIPVDYFEKKNILLRKYDDADNQVANDVADCAMWHTLEGYRKFSLVQQHLRTIPNTIDSRAHIRGDKNLREKFAFGHELSYQNSKALSPMNKKVLVLGFGKMAQMLCKKLKYGLNMDVYYTTRSGKCRDISANDFKYFPWKQWENSNYTVKSSEPSLCIFETIVNCLPGTPETTHMINEQFLSKCCPLNQLILVNVGRGSLIDPHVIETHHEEFRHLGLDVFYHEPLLSEIKYLDANNSTFTPHIGSSTEQCFAKASEYCISQLLFLDELN